MRDAPVSVRFLQPHEPPPFPPAIPRRLCLCLRACHPEREVAKLDVSGRFDRCRGHGRKHDDERAPASESAHCGHV